MTSEISNVGKNVRMVYDTGYNCIGVITEEFEFRGDVWYAVTWTDEDGYKWHASYNLKDVTFV